MHLLWQTVFKKATELPQCIGCSERSLIGHSFYRWNFLRKSCTIRREKCRRAAPRTEKPDKPEAAFFSASGAALS
jgi:hypothetical protein